MMGERQRLSRSCHRREKEGQQTKHQQQDEQETAQGH
jgi:hypothetical protein